MCFIHQNPYLNQGLQRESTKCILPFSREGIFSTEIRLFYPKSGHFWTKRGYFVVLPERAFRLKQRAFKRTILEKSTNRGKSDVTRKFTPAR